MLGLYEYMLLNIDDKATLLWEDGEFVISAVSPENTVSLYSLYGYFVEVTVDKASTKITDIVPFTKGAALEKYLDKINIDALL